MGRAARKRKTTNRERPANDFVSVMDATPERIAKSEGSEFVDPATIDSSRHRIGRVRRFKDSWIDRMYRRDQLTYAQWYAAGWYRDRYTAGFSHPKVTASYGGTGSSDGVNYGQPRDARQWDARKLYRMARDRIPAQMVRLVEAVVIDDQMPPFSNGQQRDRFARRVAAALQPVAEWIGAPGANSEIQGEGEGK